MTEPIETTGLLIAGHLHDVPGLTVWAPASVGGPAYAALDPGDYAMRPTTWVRQIVLHTTGGLWPQPVHAGAGPAGHARDIADMWRGERTHSAAQLLVDFDGSAICLADLVYAAAYHAEGSNPWSVGIEMCTLPNGGIYEATLKTTAQLVVTLCSLLGIPFQIPRGPYRNAPLRRCETGTGPTRHQLSPADLVGVIGHRDNTSERGFGDPGDAIWSELAALGAEGVDYDGREEQILGRQRQAALNAADARAGATWRPLVVDGIVGPESSSAARRLGFTRWRDVPA
jgi:hypothetical protein